MPLAPDDAAQVAAQLTSLTPERAAALLRHAGSQRISAEVIQADLDAGAPANADGSLNLIVYAAWLVRELARRERAHG